jgi:hypothetical protein
MRDIDREWHRLYEYTIQLLLSSQSGIQPELSKDRTKAINLILHGMYIQPSTLVLSCYVPWGLEIENAEDTFNKRTYENMHPIIEIEHLNE